MGPNGDGDLNFIYILYIFFISQALKFTFDVVVFDCEGCYHHIVRENMHKFRKVKKIIME